MAITLTNVLLLVITALLSFFGALVMYKLNGVDRNNRDFWTELNATKKEQAEIKINYLDRFSQVRKDIASCSEMIVNKVHNLELHLKSKQ